MAIVKFLHNTSQKPAGLKAVTRYVTDEEKTRLPSGKLLVTGVNCNPEFAFQEFMLTKQTVNKTDGKYFYQLWYCVCCRRRKG
ncbi:MAG: hypothetical protein BWY15_02040 [Firmicutes bacterium ADurb.Bin193]|nr:MAG: hypothetical protein BWY15_02040 [Firmicutes bacterium ADurb.Bin193]